MKKNLLLPLFVLLFTASVKAQSPSMVCYQAVATNASGAELVSTDISIRASILKGSTTGTAVYTETHDVKTDQFGLFTLDLGSKAAAGTDLSKVDWGKGPYFLKIEMSVPRGGVFREIGTSQLLSVPYALHAGKADTATYAKNAINDKDSDPTNELQAFEFDRNSGKLKLVAAGSPTGSAEITLQDADADPTNELQTLKFDPNTGVLGIYDRTGAKNGEVNTREGFFTKPGSSPAFPQGIIGTYRFIKKNESYTVPPNKTFYVTANGNANTSGSIPMAVEYLGFKYSIISYAHCPVLPSGARVTNTTFTGFEVDKDANVEPVIIDLKSPYQIPAGKILIIKTGLGESINTLDVDGEITSFYSINSGSQVVTIPGGISGVAIKDATGFFPVLTGYLISMP